MAIFWKFEADWSGAVKDQNLPICKAGFCHVRVRVKMKHVSANSLCSYLGKHHRTNIPLSKCLAIGSDPNWLLFHPA